MVTKADEIEDAVNEMMSRARGEQNVMDGLTYPYIGNPMLFNHIRFFHPDGTYSDIAGPTYNPKKPTPFLERFLFHWTRKRGPNGGRWYFLKPQSPEPELPLRCFVEGCTRRGGFKSILHVYQHVMAKHHEESGMYADVLERMKKQTQAQLDPQMAAALGMSTATEKPAETNLPPLFVCRVEGCERFFDTEQGRKLHEKKGHK